jgi:peptidoglycan/LPS O-acetylase OafA/YrhL
MDRVKYLDGHRGLAILLVFLFHSYSRWTELVPYGDKYSNIWLFEYGFLGVQLFFIISGFVILMSLEKSSGVKDFLTRRWFRLFPAMLICSILIYVTAPFFTDRPSGQPELSYILPGLSFIDFNIWKVVFGYPEKQLEGVFWSLYVEFKFYIFAAIIYFSKGRNALLLALVLAFGIACFTRFLTLFFTDPFFLQLDEFIKLLSFRHFGWFAIGASYYIYTRDKKIKWFYYGILISIFCSMVPPNMSWQSSVGSLIICFVFGASVVSKKIQYILTSRFLLFLGFISYPFYLIHENSLISSIIQLNDLFPSFPAAILPLIILIILSLVSYLIVKYLEVNVRNCIFDFFVKFFKFKKSS